MIATPFVGPDDWPVSVPASRCREHTAGGSLQTVDVMYCQLHADADCSYCSERLKKEAEAYVNLYHDDECGFFLCPQCFTEAYCRSRGESTEASSAAAGGATATLCDRRLVRAVACSDNLTWSGSTSFAASPTACAGSATLAAPHSDCGYGRATCTAKNEACWVVYDLGAEVTLPHVSIHNWCAGCYPSCVSVSVGTEGPDGEFTEIAADAPLSQCSVWELVEFRYAARGVRWVRITFMNTFDPTECMTLGVVHFGNID